MEPRARIEALLEEIILGLEGPPGFDLEAYLARHPDEAADLRARLVALGKWRLIGTPHPDLLEDPLPSLQDAFEERYELRAPLGSGAMGQVVCAWDRKLEREVAIKFLDPPREGHTREERRMWRARFLREARLASQLQHHGIAPVHDFGLAPDGRWYFTMRRVAGEGLDAWLSKFQQGDPAVRAELTLVRRVQITQRLCETIAYAHAAGILHRDLKPANVMLAPQGEVLVLDWGLARRLLEPEAPAPAGSTDAGSRRGSSLRTASGTIIGTPSYLAPEQATGRPADERSDVFGIAAVLVHLLTGRPPYWDDDRGEVLRRARECDLNDKHLSHAADGWDPRRVPRELAAICRKALSKEPGERYPDVTALGRDLQAFLEDRQGVAWRDPLATRLAKLARRRPAVTASVALSLVGAFLALALGQQVVRARERERLDLEQRLATELPTVRELGARYAVASDSLDYALWAREWLAKFRELGLDLEAPEAGQRVVARLAELRRVRPDAEVAVRRALYDTGFALIRAGALYGWMEAHGEPIPAHPRFAASAWEPLAKRYRAIAERDPGLIELWPRFAALLETVEDDPWRREVWNAQLAWWRERRDAIGDLSERSAGRDGNDLVWFGTVVLSVRSRADALPILERAAWQDRDSFWAHFELARVHEGLAAGDPEHLDRAIEHNLIATALNPDSAWAHTNLGKSYVDRAVRANQQAKTAAEGERERFLSEHDESRRLAIESYERAITLNPGLAAPRTNLANATADEQPDEAERHHRLATESEPCNYASLVSYAAFQQARGRSDEELALRKRVAECFPDRPDVLADVAMLHHERGSQALSKGDEAKGRAELQQAVEAYHATLRVKPDFLYMEQNLGLAYLELGRVEEGLEWLEQCVAHRNEDLGSNPTGIPKVEHERRLQEILSRHPLSMLERDQTEGSILERVKGLKRSIQDSLDRLRSP